MTLFVTMFFITLVKGSYHETYFGFQLHNCAGR